MPTEVTFSEVSYFVSIGTTTRNIGNAVAKSTIKSSDLMLDKVFRAELFTKHKEYMNKAGLGYEDDSKLVKKIGFNRNHHGLKIIVWVGSTEPNLVVTHCGSNIYNLNMECLLYLNTPKLFVAIMNKYLESCDDEELDRIVNGDMFSYTVHTNSIIPYCTVEIKHKRELRGIYSITMRDCSPDYTACEMSDAYSGHFLHVRKELLAKRSILIMLDITQVD